MGSALCLPMSRDSWARLDRMQEEEEGGGSFKDVLKLNLSSRDVKTIHKIWDDLKTVNKGQIGIRCFELIFEKCPEVKKLFVVDKFPNPDALKDQRMIRHAIIFQDTLEMIINTLGPENDQLNSLLIAFGSQHSFYTRRGFNSKYWTVFGEALTDLLLDDLPAATPYQRRRMKRLWFKVIYFIIASMRTGYAIGSATKMMVSSSRRWWKDNKRRQSTLERQLIEVLYVTNTACRTVEFESSPSTSKDQQK